MLHDAERYDFWKTELDKERAETWWDGENKQEIKIERLPQTPEEKLKESLIIIETKE